jgi:hypothetical protein
VDAPFSVRLCLPPSPKRGAQRRGAGAQGAGSDQSFCPGLVLRDPCSSLGGIRTRTPLLFR